MTAVLHHVLLLLSLRHNGDGLPRATAPWAAIVALCCFVAYLRWGLAIGPAVQMLGLLLFALLWGKRFSAGVALVSIGIDFVAVALAFAAIDHGRFLMAWEAVAYLAFWARFRLDLF
jgi:hypothetical protein